MKKVYLSGSQQPHNIYADNLFTEQEVMHALINKIKPLLEKLGFEVKCSTMGKTMMENIAEGNAYNADIYVACHSNASGTGVGTGHNDGTLGLFYPSPESMRLTKCIYEEVCKVTPSSDEGMREGKGLAELRRTHMPATLIESFYHDNVKDMKDSVLHLDAIANAFATGIWKYFNQKV